MVHTHMPKPTIIIMMMMMMMMMMIISSYRSLHNDNRHVKKEITIKVINT